MQDVRINSLRIIMASVYSELLMTSRSPSNDDHAIFPDRHEDVTFVNRPFPLDEAPEHFARLRRWGLTFSAPQFQLVIYSTLTII